MQQSSFHYTLYVNYKVCSDACSKNSTTVHSYQYSLCYIRVLVGRKGRNAEFLQGNVDEGRATVC